MTEQQAMRLALEAMVANNKAWKHLADSGDAGYWEAEEQAYYQLNEKAITALRQALEQQPAGEPVGSFMTLEQAIEFCLRTRPDIEPTEQHIAATIDAYSALFGDLTPADTRPQPAAWVGLTLEDKKEYLAQDFGGSRTDAMDWAEAKLREKNTGETK